MGNGSCSTGYDADLRYFFERALLRLEGCLQILPLLLESLEFVVSGLEFMCFSGVQ